MGNVALADLQGLEEAMCRQDRMWMMERHFVIHNKMGQLQYLCPLRQAQKRALKILQYSRARNEPARCIIGKSRKKGFSTLFAADAFYEYLTRDINVIIIAHEKELAETIIGMMHLYYEYLDKTLPEYEGKIPIIRKPRLYKGQSAKDEIRFDGYHGKIWIGTARNVYAGTGMTPQYLFATEVSKWDTGSRTAISLLQSVAYKPGTTVVEESTFNGEDTLFFPTWRKAYDYSELRYGPDDEILFEVKDSVKWNYFVPMFTGAGDDPDIPLNFNSDSDKARFITTITEQEQMWVDKFGVSPEFLKGMRIVAQNQCQGKDDIRSQEYPMTPEEAVIASGAHRFNIQKLTFMQIKYQEPGERGELYHSDRWDKKILFRRDMGGYMVQFRKPAQGHRYVIGCDTAEGKLDKHGDEQDATVADVYDLDAGMEQVACIFGNISSENIIAPLAMLGEYYNRAFIVIENNSSGSHTCVEMGKIYPRERLYHSGDIVEDSHKRLSREVGFKTHLGTKGNLIGNLAEAIETENIIFHLEKTFDEMRHYIKKPGGGTEAAPGYHDDHCIAAALAVVGAQSRPVLLDRKQMDEIERYYQKPKVSQFSSGRNSVTGY